MINITSLIITSTNIVIKYISDNPPINPIKSCNTNTDDNFNCLPPVKQNDETNKYRGEKKTDWITTWKEWNGANGYCMEQGQSGKPYSNPIFFQDTGDWKLWCQQGLRYEGGGYDWSNVIKYKSWGGACKFTNRCSYKGVDTGGSGICTNWIDSFGRTGFVKITNNTDLSNAAFENNESPIIPVAFGHGISGDERCGGCHLIRRQTNGKTYYVAVMTIDSATSSLELGSEQTNCLGKYEDWACSLGQSCPGSELIEFIMLDECPTFINPPSNLSYLGCKWW